MSLEDDGERAPDLQFIHKDARYPGLIVEIAYLQEGKDLQKLADHYIVESGGTVPTVIGIDLGYGGNKRATISTWCPKLETDRDGDCLTTDQTVISQVRSPIHKVLQMELIERGVSKVRRTWSRGKGTSGPA